MNKNKKKTIIILMGLVAIVFVGVLFVPSLLNDQPYPASGFRHQVIDKKGPVDVWGKTVGDIDGDGLDDLLVSGADSQELAWYKNPGWKKFWIDRDKIFTTDQQIIDMDHDGDNDVVALTKQGIGWYQNPGWQHHVIGSALLHDIEVFDWDKNGDWEIVARNQSGFGGDGSQLFLYDQDDRGEWQQSTISIPNGEGIAIYDLDQDGFTDIIVNGVWLRNNGKSGSQRWQSVTFSDTWDWEHTFIAVGDLNGDQRPDIVMTPAEHAHNRYHISWFEAPQTTTDIWQEHIIEPDVESNYHFVGIADFNRDGEMDITTAETHQGENPDEVIVYLNLGKGTSWGKKILADTGSHSMKISDYDQDGDPDLFGANWSGEYQPIELWVNQSCPPGLDRWRRHIIDAKRPWKSVFISAADIDNDQLPDIITGGWWYRNPGDPAARWERSAVGGNANNMAAVIDIDHDGALDILASTWKEEVTDGKLVWARNNGTGSFEVFDNIAPGKGDFLQGVATGDLHNSNNLDIALSWHKAEQGIQLVTVPNEPAKATWPRKMISIFSQDEDLSQGDIDADGDLDLLTGTRWLEQTTGQWVNHTLYETSESPDRNALVDLNSDGRLDAVVGYEAINKKGKLAWYEQGESVQQPWKEHVIATITGPMSLRMADMDRDGDLDAVVGEHNYDHPDQARLLVYENLDGKAEDWQEHLVYQGDEHHDGAFPIDIDLDGDLDILSIGWGHDNVLLYENNPADCQSEKNSPIRAQ
jgi:hypothetical protein